MTYANYRYWLNGTAVLCRRHIARVVVLLVRRVRRYLRRRRHGAANRKHVKGYIITTSYYYFESRVCQASGKNLKLVILSYVNVIIYSKINVSNGLETHIQHPTTYISILIRSNNR